jgi:hypothetical protein
MEICRTDLHFLKWDVALSELLIDDKPSYRWFGRSPEIACVVQTIHAAIAASMGKKEMKQADRPDSVTAKQRTCLL